MNNIRNLFIPDRISDEAAAWIVKIHGQTYKTGQNIPDEMAEDLRAWLGQSPAHRECFLEMSAGWDALGILEELADIFPLEEIKRRNGLGAVVGRWFGGIARRKLRFALSGAVAASMAAVAWFAVFSESPPVEYVTGVGEQNSFVLSDASTVTLNTNSRITVDFGDERRVVVLEQGEANFDVTTNSELPFVVYAGDGMVWVVGTEFNVNDHGDFVNVIVTEGTVKVFSGVELRDNEPLLIIDDGGSSSGSGSVSTAQDVQAEYFREVVLNAHEAARYSQGRVSKERLDEQRLLKDLAWQEGSLVFNGETLEEALAEISRYTDKELVIADPDIRHTSVGGRYLLSDIDSLIGSLALALNIRAEYGDGESVHFLANTL